MVKTTIWCTMEWMRDDQDEHDLCNFIQEAKGARRSSIASNNYLYIVLTGKSGKPRRTGNTLC